MQQERYVDSAIFPKRAIAKMRECTYSLAALERPLGRVMLSGCRRKRPPLGVGKTKC